MSRDIVAELGPAQPQFVVVGTGGKPWMLICIILAPLIFPSTPQMSEYGVIPCTSTEGSSNNCLTPRHHLCTHNTPSKVTI